MSVSKPLGLHDSQSGAHLSHEDGAPQSGATGSPAELIHDDDADLALTARELALTFETVEAATCSSSVIHLESLLPKNLGPRCLSHVHDIVPGFTSGQLERESSNNLFRNCILRHAVQGGGSSQSSTSIGLRLRQPTTTFNILRKRPKMKL
eukprot:3675467-Amphidinium_carterae.1